MHSALSLLKAPLVDAHDASHGPGPKRAGMVFHDVNGRGDGEAPAGPSEAVAFLELSLDLRGRDLQVPGWPPVDLGVQVPHDVERGCNVDLVVCNDGRVAIDAVSVAISATP